MTFAQMKYASQILREEYPKPLISHTVDVFKGLSATEREILLISQKIYPPRLMQNNPKS
jgi:hypothetical protein